MVLLSKRNGDLECKSFRRNSPATSLRLAAETLLKHLILKRLEFDSLKQILCLSFQRRLCILQTSVKQIACLSWQSDQENDIIWALEVGEFAVWSFCDKIFVNYEPHTKSLHLYSLFEGKIKQTVQLEFSDSLPVSPVRQISAGPDGKMFAILTDSLLVGKKKLRILLQDGKNVCEISMGTSYIAVFTRQPEEYLLFNLATFQRIYCCSVGFHETIIFSQRFDRYDKVMKNNSIRDLKESEKVDVTVSIDVRASLLATAINSQHLESIANILKIAEEGFEVEICHILRVLDSFLITKLVDGENVSTKNSSHCSSVEKKGSLSSSFGLQVLGLSLGFAGRAHKKFPDCATIFNLIFAWQELLPVNPQEPASFKENAVFQELTTKWHGWDEYSIVKDALIHNHLALAQYELSIRGDCNFRDLNLIREAIISEIQQGVVAYDFRMINEAETIIRNLGCEVPGTWEKICLQAADPKSREKLVEIMQQRHLWTAELMNCLDFITFAECYVRDSLGNVPVLTMEMVLGWNSKQRSLYLAEAFLQSKNEQILARIQPEDVWQVMLNKQILSTLKKWIENQAPSNHAVDENIPYIWPISNAMVDMAAECKNNDTRDSVLNLLANQGVFAECERQSLVAFITRLLSIGQFHQVENIVRKPLANVTLQSITTAALDYCAHEFNPELFYDLISDGNIDLNERPTWMKLVQRFQSWKLDPSDSDGFVELCRLNNTLLKETNHLTEEEFWMKHPFVALFFHLMNPILIPDGTMSKALKSLPMFAHVWDNTAEDPSIHQLLVGEVPINVANFFKYSQKEYALLGNPHSPRAESARETNQGLTSCLDWTFYLKQSRPFRAFFHLQQTTKTKEEIATYPFAIQAIGLEDPWNNAISRSCVLLIEMLGFNAHPVRTTLAVLQRLTQDPALDRKNLVNLTSDLLVDSLAPRSLSELLEDCLLKNNSNDSDAVKLVTSWHLAIEFCTVYGLGLPIKFLTQCASRNHWQIFLLFIQIYNYPFERYREILREFSSPIKFHLQLAMQPAFSTETSQTSSSIYVSNTTTPNETFYRLLLQGSTENASNLLTCSLVNRSVELAVVTAVLEPRLIYPCLCVYLSLNLHENSPMLENETTMAVPDMETLSNLVLEAMSSHRFHFVLEAFNIFVPHHWLTRMLNWLDSFMKGESERDKLELVRDAISLYEEGDDMILFRQSMNLFHFALHILSWALCYLIQDADQQQDLLTMWADVQPFDSLAMDVSVPDFGLLAEIVTLCVHSGIDVNIANLMQGSNSLQFQQECLKAVEILLDQRNFDVALKLAKISDVPADSIFVTQLHTMFESQTNQNEAQTSSLRYRTAFWNRCHQLLTVHHVRPDLASNFFRDVLPKAQTSWESHLMIDHALKWMRLVKPIRKDALVELEVLWWQTRIEADLDSSTPSSLLDLQPDSPMCPLLMAKINEMADALPYAQLQSTYSDSFLEKVSEWIGRNLDAAELVGALKLSYMFRRQSPDLLLILFMIDLVENNVDMPRVKSRLLQIIALKDKEVEWKDRQSAIEYIDNELLKHGHVLCQRLLVFHQVAVILDLKYEYVVEHSRPISILKMLLETPTQSSGLQLAIGGHLNLARNWITASRIAMTQVVDLVKDELIEAARSAYGQVSTETNMVVSLLRGTFNRWVTLCADPTQLGRALLQATLDLEENNEWPVAVELLIFSHSSFTLACDVENIGQILNHARSFIDKLLLDQQWILITRLTTGIQRYTEMSYVFELLKEHDQFEYLLRKGMDRLPLLRQALLDFLRPNCLENRELFRLVALHFHMHAEVAGMWQDEANSLLKPVISQAFKSILKTSKKPTGSPLPKTVESSPAKKSSTSWSLEPTNLPTSIDLPMLKASPEMKKIFTAAMHNLAHATEYFLQAGKLSHANQCALQAELVALQIHLVSRAADGQHIYCILGLNAAQVDVLICETLTYPEAEIVSRGYGFSVTWGKALMRHYVLNDGSDYLERFIRRHTITPTIVEQVVAAFELESGFSKKSETLDRLERLVSMLTDAEVKYRLASRLGLRHLVGELLSSSALPYLRDTAWGKKANQD
ncbi:hypothetical protein OUZ56_003057 [Daphnia magna]|nr:hypothetical protein OUZ56_003057 [Daphnia magna]